MDHEFRENEMGTNDAERKYNTWMAQLGKLLNLEIFDGSDVENEVFDYYFAAMTPEEAAVEYKANHKEV
jgi:hypothetical protein